MSNTRHVASDNSRAYQDAAKRAVLWALLAGFALGLVYFVIVSLVNSIQSAYSTFLDLWYWMIPLVSGFSLQVGLFVYSRILAHQAASPHSSGVVASGGASAVSMVACCSHYLSNVLPLLGLTGLSLVLSNFQTVFLAAGLLSNIVGISYLLGVMGQHRLYDPNGKRLALLLVWPVHRAVPYVAVLAVLTLVATIYVKVSQ